MEYNISYIYHAMYAYFARDNVYLPGIAKHFQHESVEERSHAEILAGGVLRTSTRPTVHILLLLRGSISAFKFNCALTSVECLISTTLPSDGLPDHARRAHSAAGYHAAPGRVVHAHHASAWGLRTY